MFLIVWLMLILVLSVLPLKTPETEVPGDKIAHFVMYGLTSVLLYRHFRKEKPRFTSLAGSIVFASVYGALIEVMQSFIPHRSFSAGDMAANAAGAFVCCIFYSAWRER